MRSVRLSEWFHCGTIRFFFVQGKCPRRRALTYVTLHGTTEGKTAIAIAHQDNSIARLDCIIFLDQGRILEDGSHFEILERNGLYAPYYNRQSGEFIDTETPEAAE
jgi:ABC-type multidrug transport system ATPase subunit